MWRKKHKIIHFLSPVEKKASVPQTHSEIHARASASCMFSFVFNSGHRSEKVGRNRFKVKVHTG